MGLTKVDELKVPQARVYLGANPIYPYQYYGVGENDVDSCEWRGGEMVYNTSDSRFYIQTATSGKTATWKRLLETAVSI